MTNKKEGNSNPSSDQHISETSPSPHGESKVLKMPINTDQRNATGGRNIPQIPNTVGGKLNPSMVHEFQGRVLTKEGTRIQPGEVKRTRASKSGKNVTTLGGKKKDA